MLIFFYIFALENPKNAFRNKNHTIFEDNLINDNQ